MELNKKNITEIFRKNFNFPIIDTEMGRAIKMDAISAFCFASVTGAGYLDNPIYPFSPKGVLKILREAFQYNIVTGIFDKHKLFRSPVEMSKDKSYLFEGDKYLILDEGLKEIDFSDHLSCAHRFISGKGLKTTDFLFFRIEAWKNGNGMECFLEYLACEIFKNKNYIVENQIPLVHAVGSPDFGGFHMLNAKKGFHIFELAMVRLTGDKEIFDNLNIDHVIVGEAKTATTIMAGQLEKYLNTTAFLKGYEMHPEKSLPSKNCFGMLNIEKDYSIRCIEPLSQYADVGSIVFDFNEYMEWYQNNLKFYIIANFTNEELREFVEARIPKGEYNQAKIIQVVKNTSLQEIVNNVKEVL